MLSFFLPVDPEMPFLRCPFPIKFAVSALQ